MEQIHIRRFQAEDAGAVSHLIVHTLRTTNSRDYPAEFIEKDAALFTPDYVCARAAWTHFYVAERQGEIVACGAIGPYWGSETESSLFNLFVHPDLQGQGVGRSLIGALERDPFFLRARRVEIPASITGCPFYQKMGYAFKNGRSEPDDEGLIRMEKVNKR